MIIYNKKQLSPYTRSLLALHLYWIDNGYDRVKLNDVIKSVGNQKDFYGYVSLYQIVEITGKPINNDFELVELEKLTYFYLNRSFYIEKNLSFLKYCENIVEVDFTGTELVDIRDFKYLKNLVKAKLNFNRINSIEALTTLTNIEELMLDNSNVVSLEPLLNHKKIKKIELNVVDKEEDILNIISNQEVISAQYLFENRTALLGLSFPRYLVKINLEKDMLFIDMASDIINKYGFNHCLEIPTEFIEDDDFIEAYKSFFKAELDKRVKAILKTNYEIIESEDYYTYDVINFGIEVRIRKL